MEVLMAEQSRTATLYYQRIISLSSFLFSSHLSFLSFINSWTSGLPLSPHYPLLLNWNLPKLSINTHIEIQYKWFLQYMCRSLIGNTLKKDQWVWGKSYYLQEKEKPIEGEGLKYFCLMLAILWIQARWFIVFFFFFFFSFCISHSNCTKYLNTNAVWFFSLRNAFCFKKSHWN